MTTLRDYLGDPADDANREVSKDESKPKRLHRATFARDKFQGGWNVRVIGPTAARFQGRTVPVTRIDNSETLETLETLLWTGKDDKTGAPIALYSFTPKKAEQEDLPF